MSDREHFLSGGPNNHPACHRTAKSQVDPQSVENFRRKLKYFFMSPCQKYRARGRKPWKMMLQILKIVIITFQLVSFGLSNEMMVTFKEENIIAFKHLFLKNYQDRNQDYALYTRHEVHDHILYIINRYLQLQNLTVDNHAFERIDDVFTPLSICQDLYRHANVLPANETFDIDPHVETGTSSFVIITQLYNLIQKSIQVLFVLHLANLNIKCLKVCFAVFVPAELHYQLIVLFDCVVICSCLLSLILCTRSVYNGMLLQFVSLIWPSH
uniref:Mucolipin-3-like n=1 Tax=Sinocyclocheilus rhinocerous TaxID=307959 RepID=A0A673HDL8_9TELE